MCEGEENRDELTERYGREIWGVEGLVDGFPIAVRDELALDS